MASEKQVRQRKFYVALGTVTGFHGYLHNLVNVVDSLDISEEDKLVLDFDVRRLQIDLLLIQSSILDKMKQL